MSEEGNRGGRKIIITGASSGIGYSLSKVFSENGDHIIALARSETKLGNLKREIEKNNGKCDIHQLDITDSNSIEQAVKAIIRNHKTIEVLINNAGVTSFKEFAKTTLREFDEVMGTNLRGTFLLTKLILKSMLRRREGLIMNILSYAAKTTFVSSSA